MGSVGASVRRPRNYKGTGWRLCVLRRATGRLRVRLVFDECLRKDIVRRLASGHAGSGGSGGGNRRSRRRLSRPGLREESRDYSEESSETLTLCLSRMNLNLRPLIDLEGLCAYSQRLTDRAWHTTHRGPLDRARLGLLASLDWHELVLDVVFVIMGVPRTLVPGFGISSDRPRIT